MLTDRAVAFLRPLTFSAAAECRCSVIPLAGIYWVDEMPNFRALRELPKQDQHGIYRLFSIREEIWAGSPPEGDDKVFWENAKAQVPQYALFQRLELSEQERATRARAEVTIMETLTAVF